MTLTERRLAKEWSVAELAEKSGLSEFTIYALEGGDVERPRMSTLRKLARAYDVTVADLVADLETKAAA